MEKLAEIVARADTLNKQINATYDELENQLRSIDSRAFREGRVLSAAEDAQEDQLRGSQRQLRNRLIELGYNTLIAIDNSAEVRALAERMKKVNGELQADIIVLKRIVGVSAAVAQGADTLAQVAAGAAALVAKLP